MTNLDRAYTAKDEAEAELEALRAKEQACMDAIREAVNGFAEHLTASNAARLYTLDAMTEMLNDFAADDRWALEGRADEARGNLESAEQSDLQKSAMR